MKPYADYVFYRDTYNGAMEEKDFNQAALQATQFLRYYTMKKADTYTGDELKFAVCEAADVVNTLRASSGNKNAKGKLKSENTDGYSVSYVVEGKDGETEEELSSRKLAQVARKWLLTTGLLSRKAGCACACKYGLDYL